MATEPLYTAAEMRAAEDAHEGATLELMERAGAATAEAALRRYPDARRFSVWCGAGSNGGDGLVVARALRQAGRDVVVRLAAPEDTFKGAAAEMLAKAHASDVRFTDGNEDSDLVVDAVFGTGFTGPPRREAARLLEEMASLPAPVLAVDVPSGIDASTGEVFGPAVTAEHTVTFHACKVGLAVAPGRFHAGEVAVADIGLAPVQTRNGLVSREILDLVPRRSAGDNKYSAGSVLVVSGSTGLSGAPSLTAQSALRSGAGYVAACVPASLNVVFEQRLVEVVTRPCPDENGVMTVEAADVVLDAADRAGAIALGPGLGRTDAVRALVGFLLDRLDKPIVVDADALWALPGKLDWVFSRDAPTVLTPHAGELARLLGRDSKWVSAHRLDAVQAGADDVGATVLLKGADTLIASPGRGVLVCDLGTPGLASAGTGDVLTGIIAAFLSKGMEPRLAAAAGAAAGGVAARLAADEHGYAGLVASDVVGALSRALS